MSLLRCRNLGDPSRAQHHPYWILQESYEKVILPESVMNSAAGCKVFFFKSVNGHPRPFGVKQASCLFFFRTRRPVPRLFLC